MGSLLAALLAAENQLDVLRSLEVDSTEDLASLGRQLRFVRQRLEAVNGGAVRPVAANGGTNTSSTTAAIVRQNCEMSRMIVRLARDKEELRAALCRLEEEVSNFRVAGASPADLPNGHASPAGLATPCPSDDSVLVSYHLHTLSFLFVSYSSFPPCRRTASMANTFARKASVVLLSTRSATSYCC